MGLGVGGGGGGSWVKGNGGNDYSIEETTRLGSVMSKVAEGAENWK